MFLISLFISPGKSLLFFRFIFVRNKTPYLSLAEMVPSVVSECVKRDLTPQSKSFGEPKSKLKRTVGKFLIT